MQKQDLVEIMTELLRRVLEEQEEASPETVASASPLVGDDAIVTSLALVSFITDVEMTVDERYDVELTLVNEDALSRSKSPFRTIETLADYVLELVSGAGGP